MAIQAVLFDLDQTLWSVGPQPDWAEITALQSAELAPHFARFALDHFDPPEFVRRFWTNLNVQFPDPDSLADPPLEERRWIEGPAVLRSTLAEHGATCAEDDASALWEALNNVPLRHFNIRLFADAASTVEALRAAGYRLAIVTARPLTEAIVRRELRDQGLPDVFEAVVTSGEVGYRKPHPLVFGSALARLGVPPDEAIVVGDSYEDDIVPAAKLGIIPVLKLNDRAPDPRCTLARHHVPSLAALLDLEVLNR